MKFLNKIIIESIVRKDERSWLDTFKLFIPLIMGFFILDIQYLKPLTSLSNDGHGLASLDRAYAKVFCKKEGMLPGNFSTKKNDLHTPLNKIFGDVDSQKEKICANVVFSVLNEPSLSNLNALIFKIYPKITLFEMSIVLMIIKIFMILTFSFLLLKIGMSLLYVLFISITAYFLVYCVNLTHHLFLYSFLIPNFLFLVSLSIFYLYGLKKFGYKFLVFGILVGAFGAYYCNFRTSHTPIIYYILFLVCLCSYIVTNTTIKSKIKRIFLIPLTLITFVFAFQFSWYLNIKSITDQQGDRDNRVYHSVTHPLVLALGADPSDLATREGIKWLDEVGESLAHKIDPSANYLGENYEKALLVYYFKLWVFYPKEMYQIYTNKFKNFTTLKAISLNSNLNEKFLIPYVNHGISNIIIEANLSLIDLLSYYYWEVWGIFLLSIVMLILFYRKLNIIEMFLALSIVGSCIMLLLESIIILHYFVATYHILINLLYLTIALYYLQIFINFCCDKILKKIPNYEVNSAH